LEAIRILLVDDEAQFLETLGQRLTLRGFSVLTAGSGLEALETLSRAPVDVVVLDVFMPGMNGIATLKRIKQDHPGVEVILLTAHANLEASLDGMALGAYDYLTKPIKIDKLIDKINQAHTHGRKPQQAAQDETFSEKMQQSIMAADRLASLGTLAAGVAHEINNPLAIIAEATGWLQSKVNAEPEISERLRDHFLLALGKITSSVDRARRISRGLLNYARRTDAIIQEVDLRELAAEVVELTKKTASNTGAQVSIETLTDKPVIWVDPYQLRQVLLNLCTNALQAVKQGGWVKLIIDGGEDTAWITIQDNGIGIPPENLERIFEPFFTTKPSDQGTGLGLSVSRGIVEKLGGKIDVESRLGEGTSFTVTLPRQAAQAN
jgi:signal transduction histidine kinase